MRIAFDIGGVLSKYPEAFCEMISCLRPEDVFVISDMHPKEKIVELLRLNKINVWPANVYSADYDQFGEACKVVLLDELNIDMFFDDFIGYVTTPSRRGTVRCLVMPDAELPYYADTWKMPEGEPVFGRRTYKKKVT